jgi:hypothetical protein
MRDEAGWCRDRRRPRTATLTRVAAEREVPGRATRSRRRPVSKRTRPTFRDVLLLLGRRRSATPCRCCSTRCRPAPARRDRGGRGAEAVTGEARCEPARGALGTRGRPGSAPLPSGGHGHGDAGAHAPGPAAAAAGARPDPVRRAPRIEGLRVRGRCVGVARAGGVRERERGGRPGGRAARLRRALRVRLLRRRGAGVASGDGEGHPGREGRPRALRPRDPRGKRTDAMSPIHAGLAIVRRRVAEKKAGRSPSPSPSPCSS